MVLVSVEEHDYLRVTRFLLAAGSRSTVRAASPGGGHARLVVWCWVCMRASSCLFVAGASIELS